MHTLYQQALLTMGRISDLSAATAIMGWDQETFMPPGAAQARGEHLAGLSAMAHNAMTDDNAKALVASLKTSIGELDETQQGIISCFIRDHEDELKLPESHVSELARSTTAAQEAWKKARAQSDFSVFAPTLKKLVDLKKAEAEMRGYDENPYDALIGLYDRGLTSAIVGPIFSRLQPQLTEIINSVRDKQVGASSLFDGTFDKDQQLAFGKSIVEEMGFNFNNGRIDVSTHPFCTNFAPTDVRLTTRVDEDDIRMCLFSLIHEAGHGMYEQGIPEAYFRTSAAGGTSMGIHESQSLFWEDIVGRSEAFWRYAEPRMRKAFPNMPAELDAKAAFKAVNVVEPGLIRIEADEVTYHLHIILRYEIENALINGEISVDDIPSLWNEKMQEYLGITPPDDARGCLQDIHWSFAGFGYFPSYSLGKLYAAMFREQLYTVMPGADDLIEKGEFAPILEWLNANIHAYGRTKNSEQLAHDVCGAGLSEEPFLKYVREKLAKVYA